MAKNGRKVPLKRDPFIAGVKPLQFDGVDEEEVMSIDADSAASAFLSDWQIRLDPYVTYRKYIEASEWRSEVLMRHVRDWYIRFVIDEEWDQEKYEMILDSIFVTGKPLTHAVIEKQEELYDKGELPMQIIQKRKNRRRI